MLDEGRISALRSGRGGGGVFERGTSEKDVLKL